MKCSMAIEMQFLIEGSETFVNHADIINHSEHCISFTRGSFLCIGAFDTVQLIVKQIQDP